MPAAPQLLGDGMLQFHTRFRIDPAAHGEFNDSLAGHVRGILATLDADIHASRSGCRCEKWRRSNYGKAI